MNELKGRFTRIEMGYSQIRRLPRLGKIRLGVKVKKLRGKEEIEYPKETPWFVVPEEVMAVFGKEPTELRIMLPCEDPEVFFPQKLALYGSTSGLKCHGNGREALRLQPNGEWQERTCPCEHFKNEENPRGDCTEQSSLMVLLPEVSMGGCYQITTGSFHSTVTLNSALDYIKALVGRVALIPLRLRRVPRTTHHDSKSQTHYTLELVLDGDLRMIRELRADAQGTLIPARYEIEGPVDENKALGPADEVETDAEDLAAADDKELEKIQQGLKAHQQGKTPVVIKPSPEKLPVDPEPQTNGTAAPALIPMVDWELTIYAIDEVAELVEIKKQWKAKHKVTNVMKLNAVGQQAFMEFVRTEAGKLGLPVPF